MAVFSLGDDIDFGNFFISNDTQKSADKFLSKLTPEEDITFGVILVFTGIVSIIGNGASLAVFFFRKLSPAEYFLVNISIVDIVLSIASYPCAMISSFNHKWSFGSFGCTTYAFTCYFLGLASVASLTAVAVVRYFKTCTPSLGNGIQSSTSLKIITWVYIYALFWAILPLVGFGSYEVEPFGLSCTLNWGDGNTMSQIYIVLVSIFCVFLPVIIMMFCYLKIVLLVRKSDMLVGEKRLRRQNVLDFQLTRMGFFITIGFVIGWFPYTFVSLWGAFSDKMIIPMWATPIPVLMAKSSIAYNPFIYIFLTKRYRKDFRDLVSFIISCLWTCKYNTPHIDERFLTNYTASPSNVHLTNMTANCADNTPTKLSSKPKNRPVLTLTQHSNLKDSTTTTTAEDSSNLFNCLSDGVAIVNLVEEKENVAVLGNSDEEKLSQNSI